MLPTNAEDIGRSIGEIIGKGIADIILLKLSTESIITGLLLIGIFWVIAYDTRRHKNKKDLDKPERQRIIKLFEDPVMDKKWKDRIAFFLIVAASGFGWVIYTQL
mgnify:CR=1 FL=1